MKIVLAPDKFKGSLTGMEFCNAVKKGIKAHFPDAEIISLPLADGGDGTIEVVNHYLNGKMIRVEVNNPFFQPVEASYLFSESTKTAFIEMAEASGHKLLDTSELDCKNATTFGTGELIKDAIERNAQSVILGIGGSATNDCGIGMATALGYKFLDKNEKEVKPIGADLSKISTIDTSEVHPKLKDVTFKIASDVSNPLYGRYGAAHVYAAQKGATPEDVELLNKGLMDFSKILDAHFGLESQKIRGTGAAGGMGIASITFLNGTLIPGIDLIKDLADFDTKITDADWIITGEGKLDEQTFSGKTIKGVMESARNKKIPVAAFCGSIELSENQIVDFGISYADSIISKAFSLEDAFLHTEMYLIEIAEIFAKTKLS